MSSSLDAALSGMLSHERGMDLIANNIANVNTTGYKRTLVHFQDLLDSAGILAALNGQSLPPGGVVTATGVAPTQIKRDFSEGTLQATGQPFDLAINGDGFFKVALPDGSSAYTRDGTFMLDTGGNLVTQDGYVVQPPITVPPGDLNVSVGPDGTVSAVQPYTAAELAALPPNAPTDGKQVTLGQLTLTHFEIPDGLASIGNNLYVLAAPSGSSVASIAPLGTTIDPTVPLAQAGLDVTPAAGTFSINGTAIAFDPAVDSLNAIVARINASAAGATAAYDAGTKMLTVQDTTAGATPVALADTTGNFLQSMKLIDATGATIGSTTTGIGAQTPVDGAPGENGTGLLLSGFLESSNVDMATEMTNLMMSARAYQLNLSAYKTIEQMLSAANQLPGV
jgi:flagellar basal-body rod protein FlgG